MKFTEKVAKKFLEKVYKKSGVKYPDWLFSGFVKYGDMVIREYRRTKRAADARKAGAKKVLSKSKVRVGRARG